MKKIIMLPLLLFILYFYGSDSTGLGGLNAREDKKIISVTNFDDQSVNTTMYRAFRIGIPSQISEALGTVKNLKVIARDSMMKKLMEEHELQLTGVTDQQGLIEIGKILNAQYMVTGNFMVMGQKIQINAKVIDVGTAEFVHQASVTGALDRFFILQKEVAVKVAQGLDVKMNPGAVNKMIDSYDTKNLEAYIANYEGEQKLEQYEMLSRLNKEKEMKALLKKKEAEELRRKEEIDRQREAARQEKLKKETELARLQELERQKEREKRLAELAEIRKEKAKLEKLKKEMEQKQLAETKRLEEKARREQERKNRQIESLEKLTIEQDKLSQDRDNAKKLFRKAVEIDRDYERARKNMLRLTQSIPTTM